MSSDPTDATGDRGAFKEFALRHLASNYWGARGPGFESLDEVDLLPGSLPTDLAFELPVPESGRVVATFVRPHHPYVFIRMPEPASDVNLFYLTQLKAIAGFMSRLAAGMEDLLRSVSLKTVGTSSGGPLTTVS